MTYYYKDTAGHEVGPVSEDEIHTFRTGGLLLDETLIRAADSADWTSYVAKFGRISATKSGASNGTKFTLKHWVAIGLLAAAVPLFYGIRQEHALSFALTLDGKDIRPPKAASVSVDGAAFASGNRISAGRHFLVVQLEGAEPIERHFWVVFGAKDLGGLAMDSSKGSLLVNATPLPAIAIVQDGSEVVRQGAVPLTIEKLPVGDYTVLVRRGQYEERKPIKIQRQQQTEAKIELKLGGVDLSAQPPEADFILSGNGRSWQGRFPARLDDVPVGTYRLVASRKGWSLESDVQVSRGNITVNKFEFPYGAIELSSDPVDLTVAMNGVGVGKTPTSLRELKPGSYTLTASDGENELNADITVAPREQAKHSFAFHYGAVQLASTPPGATVVRKGKELGKTPLTLSRLLTGDTTFELRLDGYESATSLVRVEEGATANRSVKLFSERYVRAVKQAAEALHAGRFAESQRLIASALELEPNDPPAIRLRDEVSQAAHKAEVAQKEADERVKRENERVQRREFAEQAAQKRRNFYSELAKLPESQDFDIHTHEFPYSFDTVWGAAYRLLLQKDNSSIADETIGLLKQTVLYQQPTKGVLDFLGRGDYRNHWMLITPVDQENTRVELKLFNFELAGMEPISSPAAYVQWKVQSGQPYKLTRSGIFTYGLVLDKDLVRRRAAEFFDEVGKSLPSSTIPKPKQQNDVNVDTPSPGLLEQLVALENKISELAKSGDRSRIESMLDPAYTLVQDDRSFSRSAYLSTIKPMAAIISFAVESPEARLDNDRAVLTGYMILQLRQQSQSKTVRYKFRDVFAQRDGRWLFLSSEVVTDNLRQ